MREHDSRLSYNAYKTPMEFFSLTLNSVLRDKNRSKLGVSMHTIDQLENRLEALVCDIL